LVIDDSQKIDNFIRLSLEQEHYLRRVVRLNNEQNFIAINGKGDCWQVKLLSNGGEVVSFFQEKRELPIDVTLIVALPKGNGFEDIVRCTTELGVNKLLPVITDRTLPKPSDNKLRRWRKIAQEATEQSQRGIVPLIDEPKPFNQVIREIKSLDYTRFIAVARTQEKHILSYLNPDILPSHIIIATGCEGGWTSKEVETAIAHSFQPVSLGKRILRAVTAPIAMMALMAGISENSYS
jgi:16S rRNA (uracil1498-N3)-methyltransferase